MLTESVLLNSAYSLEVPATACFLQNSVVSLSMLSRSVIASISVSRSSALVGDREDVWWFIGLSSFFWIFGGSRAVSWFSGITELWLQYLVKKLVDFFLLPGLDQS